MGEFLADYFSLAAYIGFLYYFSTGLFLRFGMPGASVATRHLGMAFIYAGLLAFPYFPSAVIYHPLASIHRYMTVPMSMLQFTHLAQFFFYFPRPMAPRLARGLLVGKYLLTLIVTGIFISQTYGGPYVYHFAGHYWDFDADLLSRNVGILLLLLTTAVLITGIIQGVKAKGQRLLAFSLSIILFCIVFSAGVTNTLSRDGLIDRGVHQTYMIVTTVGGYFVALIIFLNSTRDRSSFMARIVGVSLVLFLVVFTFISSLIFQDKETAYNVEHQLQAERLQIDTAYQPDHLGFVSKSEPATVSPLQISPEQASALRFDQEEMQADHFNAFAWQEIRSGRKLEDLPDVPSFRGHKAFLASRFLEGKDATEALSELAALARRLAYQQGKIRKLAAEGFKEKAAAEVARWPAILADYRPVAEAVLESQGAEARRAVALMLHPVSAPGARIYRKAQALDAEVHFVSFLSVAGGRVLEAGFDYLDYRRFISPFAWILTLTVTLVYLLIVIGFRFFFWNTLVQPLNSLLEGVKRVNKGDLDHRLEVRISDEIGYLASSFNRMIKSIRGARKRLQQHADELEQKVIERTAELRQTLETVEALKSQQDGDYFLTSLLIRPLGVNEVQSATISVEFYVEQKKKFQFRKWEEEIGGDFCSARSVELQGRACTVILNADAMGKSIQGAGGALVLGAVFESLLERTQMAPDMKKLSPERWLKIAFQELQSVFESFDGSMLISMVLGLVDDESGLLYFINAEHPWLVLYRNGEATFIEKELKFRKIGMPDLSGRLAIETFQLQPGDVIISGSDGRDDLLLEKREDVRIINEDEELFLEIVQRADGELGRIVPLLKEYGELTDDLSLARLAYREDAPREVRVDLKERLARLQELEASGDFEGALREAASILEHDSQEFHAMKVGARLAARLGDLRRAYQLAEDYHYFRPADTKMLYLYSYLARKHGEFELAVELGERVRLRAPQLKQNLWNLIRAYVAMRSFGRAEQLLKEFLELEPGSEKARDVQEQIRLLQAARSIE